MIEWHDEGPGWWVFNLDRWHASVTFYEGDAHAYGWLVGIDQSGNGTLGMVVELEEGDSASLAEAKASAEACLRGLVRNLVEALEVLT